jgi:hypothetical protein
MNTMGEDTFSVTDRWLAAVPQLPALSDPAAKVAERLVLLLHYGIDWSERNWVASRRGDYWDNLLPTRVRLATCNKLDRPSATVHCRFRIPWHREQALRTRRGRHTGRRRRAGHGESIICHDPWSPAHLCHHFTPRRPKPGECQLLQIHAHRGRGRDDGSMWGWAVFRGR